MHLESSSRLLQLEKSLHSDEDPAQPKIKKLINKIIFKRYEARLVCVRRVKGFESHDLELTWRNAVACLQDDPDDPLVFLPLCNPLRARKANLCNQ